MKSSCGHFPPRQSNIRRKIANHPRETTLLHLPRLSLTLLLVLPASSAAQDAHTHAAPEKLGVVSFPISCRPEVQQQFDRGVALLHSFAYADARSAFQAVAAQDERCAMAHWGIAMTYFHQLWDPPILPETVPTAQKHIERAQQLGTNSERERDFIKALAALYQNADSVPYSTRALNYERAMSALVSQNTADVEAKVFYALALLANASPTDKTHSNQKQAASLLEPLYRSHPQHPGIPHYLIHAYDNAELAPKGLQAAKAYAQIAPSAPHALHMPSHIFTRLGLWDDSIASNLAAMKAAQQQGDPGEELHAMDYLVYAYLQSGRDSEADQVVQQLQGHVRPGRSRFQDRICIHSHADSPRCRKGRLGRRCENRFSRWSSAPCCGDCSLGQRDGSKPHRTRRRRSGGSGSAAAYRNTASCVWQPI